MRSWLATTLSLSASGRPACSFVDDGVDLLYHLAEKGPFDLVVAQVALAGIDGGQVLAMARTAGLNTPFVLVSAVADDRLRSLIARTEPAALVDDPFDAPALVSAAKRLLAAAQPSPGRVAWRRAIAKWTTRAAGAAPPAARARAFR